MEVYLDNAATTKPSEVSAESFKGALEYYGNPSSVYRLGLEARKLIEKSRDSLKDVLGIKKISGDKVIFTSSATEANCLAIFGFDFAKNRFARGKTPAVITTDGEHPSVYAPLLSLEKKGYRIIKIPTSGGELDMEFLEEAVKTEDNIVFASLMKVNNETGALYDIESASSILKRRYPDIHIHCDAVQALMKTDLTETLRAVDTLSVSSHKIHAPRGAGALYICGESIKKKNIFPILQGGGQEDGYRSGTENLCSICAFGSALEYEFENMKDNISYVEGLSSCLKSSLSGVPGIRIKEVKKAFPHIVNITLPRIKSETMLNFLSGRGIYVSAGSACSSKDPKLSRALTAYGSTKDEISSSIRISLSYTNRKEDIDFLVGALNEGVETLARF